MKRKDIPTEAVLKACTKSGVQRVERPSSILMRQFNASEKVVLVAMLRDYERGYLEYGVSLGTVWLSQKGEKYLKSFT